MLKQLLTGSSLCVLLFSAVPATAQAPATPAPQPEAQSAPQESPSTEVSTAEVEQFANAIKEMMSIQEQAQTQTSQAITSQGLSMERFQQILQSQRGAQGSQPQANANISDAEQQSFTQALTQISEIQTNSEREMEQAITTQGLEVDRFNEIFAMVRQDPSLQQKVEQVLQN